MFKKLVAIEPINLLPYAEKKLYSYADTVVLYQDIPKSDEEILARIDDADAVMVSFTSKINGEVIKKAPNVRYIGMCCSLYSPESASVDIVEAENQGIIVTGVRDYGDEGVVEFVVSELVQLLHGYSCRKWDSYPRELTGLKVGIIGLGVVGGMVANGLKCFGADLHYYSRTRKPEAEENGIKYRALHELLAECEVICTCLNKNTVLLHREEFEALGEHKVLINLGGSPTFNMEELEKFLEGDNYFICDMTSCLGNDELLTHKNVRCTGAPSGMTQQARKRLSDKVLNNIKNVVEMLKG